MPKHVLLSNELEDKGKIIAIHCALELFDLAYKINSSLNLRLYRCDLDISFKKNKEKYMVYKSSESEKGLSVWLYSNSFIYSNLNKTSQLLFSEEAVERSLMPEFPKVDYLLKLIGEEKFLNPFLKSISLINEVSSCYLVRENKIKSKNNLIFD